MHINSLTGLMKLGYLYVLLLEVNNSIMCSIVIIPPEMKFVGYIGVGLSVDVDTNGFRIITSKKFAVLSSNFIYRKNISNV